MPKRIRDVLQRGSTSRAMISILGASALLAMSQTAQAVCAPPAAANSPPAGTTVECTAVTLNQNGANGYGDSTQNGLTVNVRSGASVTGTVNGFLLGNDNTLNNSGAIVSNAAPPGAGVRASGNVTVLNAGTINADGGAGIGIWSTAGNATVTNSGAISAAGAAGIGVLGQTVNVVNSGTISAPDAAGIGIGGLLSGVVTNSGSILADGASGVGVGSNGPLVLNNSGLISTNGNSGTGAVGTNVTVVNTGTMMANGIAGVAIRATGPFSLANFGTIQALDPSGVGVLSNGTANVFNAGSILSPNAIFFVGGPGDILTIAPTSVITGQVVAGAGDAFQLGGAGTGLFNVGLIGPAAQYQGFTTFNVVGPATWLLTGNGAAQVWNVVGGTLGGNPTLGGLNVLGGGTVSPGFSIGTINVAGNVTFGPGSFFAVEANAAGQSDLIAATGTATLAGGTVQVTAQPGVYGPTTVYTILTANGGRTGSFAGVTDNSIFLDSALSYTPSGVLLTLTKVPFGSFGLTPNQIAVGNALDIGGGPLALAVFNTNSANEARQAFDSLSGEIHASLESALIEESRYTRLAMLNRMRTANFTEATGSLGALALGGPATFTALDNSRYTADAPTIVAPPRRDYGVWATGYGAWGQLNGDRNTVGLGRRTGGFMAGIDTGAVSIGPFSFTRLGIAGGYATSDMDVKLRASHANVESGHLGAYWSSSVGGFNLRSGAALAFHQIDTSRSIAFSGFNDAARASYDGYTAQSFGEIGYGFAVGKLAMEPFVGLTGVWVETDRFTEIGGAAALNGTRDRTDATYATAGSRLASTWWVGSMAVTARGTLAWQHAFGDVTPERALAFQSNAAAFGIAGVPIARDALLAEAGLDVRITPFATLGASYSGQFARDAQDHAVKGTLAVRF